jgi:hypothetical protein
MTVLTYSEVDVKYRLEDDFVSQTPIKGYDIDTEFVRLTPDGVLKGRRGFGYNGASGPTYDSEYTMVPTAEHDMLYLLMNMGLLPQSLRKQIDVFFRKRLIQCGNHYIRKANAKGWFKHFRRGAGYAGVKARAWYWYRGVRTRFGKAAAAVKPKEIIKLVYP